MAIDLDPTAKKTVRVLSNGRIDFTLTGISVLVPFLHMLPYRLAHSVYVMPGDGRRAFKLLNAAGIRSILNPKGADEVHQTMLSVEGDLVVIRETKSLSGRDGNIAIVERALVDLYFEASRDKMPVPLTEVGRILRNAIDHGGIDATKMIKLSADHHISREMRSILAKEGLVPPRSDDVINDYVRSMTAVSER